MTETIGSKSNFKGLF